jgi:phage repressor protein C with HTH and peptisase S24 domain
MPSAQWKESTALIPRLALPLDEGEPGRSDSMERHMLFATKLLEELGLAPSDAAVFSVTDTDMAPVVNPSDDVLIHLSQKDLTQGGLFLVSLDDQITIRRAVSAEGGASWILTAERPNVPAIVLSNNLSIRVYGRVRWVGHKL